MVWGNGRAYVSDRFVGHDVSEDLTTGLLRRDLKGVRAAMWVPRGEVHMGSHSRSRCPETGAGRVQRLV